MARSKREGERMRVRIHSTRRQALALQRRVQRTDWTLWEWAVILCYCELRTPPNSSRVTRNCGREARRGERRTNLEAVEGVLRAGRVVEEARAAVVLLGQRAPERGVQEREQLARVGRVLRALEQWVLCNELLRTIQWGTSNEARVCTYDEWLIRNIYLHKLFYLQYIINPRRACLFTGQSSISKDLERTWKSRYSIASSYTTDRQFISRQKATSPDIHTLIS